MNDKELLKVFSGLSESIREDNQIHPTDKLTDLANKREEKLNSLGKKLQYENLQSGTYTQLDTTGTIESNKNKVWNDLSAGGIQMAIGEAASDQIYKREDGSKYQLDAMGNERDYTGDTQRLYMYGTKGDSGAVKLGLARGDLPSSDYRYEPGRAEKEGYNVGKAGYGWDAGENGVDLNKKLLDIELPKSTAVVLEGMVHGRTDALANRQYPDYLSKEALNHASGVSEYYNSMEGMLGDSTYEQLPTESVLKNTVAANKDKLVGDYAPSRDTRMAATFLDDSMPSYNQARGFISSTLNLGAKILGTVGEGLQTFGENELKFLEKDQKRLDKVYPGEKVSELSTNIAKYLEKAGNGITKEMREFQLNNDANKLTGYSAKDVDELSAEIDATIKKDGYLTAIGKALTDGRSLEVLTNSVPEMIALAASVGGMAIVNAQNNIDLGQAELGREFTTKEKAASAVVSIVGTYLDRLGDKLALSGMNGAKGLLKEAVDQAPEKVQDMLASKYGAGILKIGEAPLKLAGAGAVEGSTEYLQTLSETAAKDPNVFKEGFTDEQLSEAAVAGVLGTAMGAHMSSGKIAYDQIKGAKVQKPEDHTEEYTTTEPSDTDLAEKIATAVDNAHTEIRRVDPIINEIKLGIDNGEELTAEQESSYGRALNNKIKSLKSLYSAAKYDNDEVKTDEYKAAIDSILDDIIALNERTAKKFGSEDSEVRNAAIGSMIENNSADVTAFELDPFIGSISEHEEEVNKYLDSISIDEPTGEAFSLDDESMKESRESTEKTQKSTEQTQGSAGQSKKSTDGKKQNPYENPDLDMGNTHDEKATYGVSARTVNKLAKAMKIPADRLAVMFKANMDMVEVKKMASKNAGDVQYDIYYGKNGIIPQYTELRVAQEERDADRANAAAEKIRARLISQIKSMTSYEMTNKRAEREAKELLAEAKLDSKTMKPVDEAGFNKNIEALLLKDNGSVKEVLEKGSAKGSERYSIKINDKIKELLGQPVDETESSKIYATQKTTVDTLTKLMAGEGLELPKVGSKVVTSADRIAKYKDTLNTIVPAKQAEIDELESEISDNIAYSETVTDPELKSIIDAKIARKVKNIELLKSELAKMIEGNNAGINRELQEDLDKIEFEYGELPPMDTSKRTGLKVDQETDESKADSGAEIVKDFKSDISRQEEVSAIAEIAKVKEEIQTVKEQGKEARDNAVKRVAEIDKDIADELGEHMKVYTVLTKAQKILSIDIAKLKGEKKTLENAIAKNNELLDNTSSELVDTVNKIVGKKADMSWVSKAIDKSKLVLNRVVNVSMLVAAKLKNTAMEKRLAEIKEELSKKYTKKQTNMYDAGKVIGEDILDKVEKLEAEKRSLLGDTKNVDRNKKLGELNKKLRELVSKVSNNTLVKQYAKSNPYAGKVLEIGKDGKGKVRGRIQGDNDNVKVTSLDLWSRADLSKGTLLGTIEIDSLYKLLDKADEKELRTLVDEASKLMDKINPLTKSSKSKEDYEIQVANNPAAQLIWTRVSEDEKPQVNKNVVAAIVMSVREYMAINATGEFYNDYEAIGRMRDDKAAYELNDGEKKWLSKGKLKVVMATSLGEAILRDLGIAPGKISDEEYSRLVADIGQVGILYAQEKKLVKPITTKDEKNGFISAKTWDVEIEEKEPEAKYNENEGVQLVLTNAKSEVYKGMQDSSKRIKDALQLEGIAKGHSFKKPDVEDKVYGVKGSYFDAPKEMQDIARVQEKEENQLHTEATGVLLETFKDRQQYLEAYGWKEIGTKDDKPYRKGMTADDAKAQLSINKELENEWDSLVELRDEVELEGVNKFWFKWFITKNGRFILDSVGINPQTNKKLHRWLVGSKTHEVEFDMTNKTHMEYFDLAIAQAFGIGTDKMDPKDIKEVAKIIKGMSEDELKAVLVKGKKGTSIDYVEGNGKEVKLEVEHPGHAAQAIAALRAMNSATDSKFKAVMTAEFDAVTSGFAIKLLQTPVLSKEILFDMLEKTGMLFGPKLDADKIVNTFNELNSQKGFVDAYQFLAKAVGTRAQEPLMDDKGVETKESKLHKLIVDGDSKLEAGVDPLVPSITVADVVTKAGRNMLKYPFMMFNYGAALASIRKMIGYEVATGIVNKIVADEDNKYLNHPLMKKVGITTKEQYNKFKEELETKPLDKIVVFTELAKAYAKIYGSRAEEVMRENFGPLIDINIAIMDSTKAMFRLYKLEFERQIKAKRESGTGLITKDEFKEIIRSLADKFPLIKAPFSEGAFDQIAIHASARVNRNSTVLEPAQTYTKVGVTANAAGYENAVGIVIQSMLRELTEAHAAGAVLPIHWLDGTVMGKLLKQGGVLGIHDAKIGSLLTAGEDVKTLNKALYETNRDYNLLEEVYNALARSINSSSKEDLSKLGDFELGNIASVVNEMEVQLDKVNTARTELYGMKAKIGNTVAAPGSMYEVNPKESNGTIPKEVEDIISRLSSSIVKLKAEPKKLVEQAMDSISGKKGTTVLDLLKGCANG